MLISGLKRLEYRGYDSAGIGVLVPNGGGDAKESHTLRVVKKKGKVANLEAAVKESNCDSTIGIAHTRWATHGAPNDVNAHPHLSDDGKIAVVHNGIIENYETLRRALQQAG